MNKLQQCSVINEYLSSRIRIEVFVGGLQILTDEIIHNAYCAQMLHETGYRERQVSREGYETEINQ